MWGSVELEPEVRDWILALEETGRARVRFHVDRLAELGNLLDEPQTRQLDGKLRELRFQLTGRQIRITYWIAPGRRIILLTVFAKTQRQERREIIRAKQAMERCVAEAHTLDWYSMGIMDKDLEKFNNMDKQIPQKTYIKNVCIDVANGYQETL